MILSILIPGKNDNFRCNGTKTIEFNLHQVLDNLEFFNFPDLEVVLCDWGSEKKIVESILERKHKNFRCVYVSPEIAKKYNGEANYSIVHSINTAFRNSSGKYVCFWDSDCFVLKDSFLKLYEFVHQMNINSDKKFYWGSRWHISYDEYTYLSSHKDLLEKINNGLQPSRKDSFGYGQNFMGGSISLLMDRSIWEESTGWYEKLPYWGWQDIEFHRRLLTKYIHGEDLVSHGMVFYHLNQPEKMDKLQNKHKFNNQLDAKSFKANPPNWGLADESLEVI